MKKPKNREILGQKDLEPTLKTGGLKCTRDEFSMLGSKRFRVTRLGTFGGKKSPVISGVFRQEILSKTGKNFGKKKK